MAYLYEKKNRETRYYLTLDTRRFRPSIRNRAVVRGDMVCFPANALERVRTDGFVWSVERKTSWTAITKNKRMRINDDFCEFDSRIANVTGETACAKGFQTRKTCFSRTSRSIFLENRCPTKQKMARIKYSKRPFKRSPADEYDTRYAYFLVTRF